MSTIIKPDEVFAIAFNPSELYDASIITESDVAVTEERYLRPIIGDDLYLRLLSGDYVQLKEDLVAPMVAAWTRYLVEPMLATRCAICHDRGPTAADQEGMKSRCRGLLKGARVLSRRLSNHLNSAAEDYPEYNPEDNPINRCSIDGDIVQVH